MLLHKYIGHCVLLIIIKYNIYNNNNDDAIDDGSCIVRSPIIVLKTTFVSATRKSTGDRNVDRCNEP